MSQTISAAEQHKSLVDQEIKVLTAKARLLEQLETTNTQLAAIRAALQGAQIGFQVAQQAADAEAEREASASSES
jgi:hypothetical protein